MNKLLGFVALGLLLNGNAYANIYLIELGLGGAGTGVGGILVFLLILYGAFFGSKIAKALIWGWVMFFVTFWYVMTLYQPDLNFIKVMISFLVAFAVLMLFAFIAEREKKKEQEKLVARHKFFLKKAKKKKKKKKKN